MTCEWPVKSLDGWPCRNRARVKVVTTSGLDAWVCAIHARTAVLAGWSRAV